RRIPPYFREQTDWQFVSSLFEAALTEKMKIQRSWIMKACRGARTLKDVHANVQRALYGFSPDYDDRTLPRKSKTRLAQGFAEGMYTELDEYFKLVLPQIERLPVVAAVYDRRSHSEAVYGGHRPPLQLGSGLSVMDLEGYT